VPRNTTRLSLASGTVSERSFHGNPRALPPPALPDAGALPPPALPDAGAPAELALGLRWLKEHLYHVSKIGADLLIDSGYLFAHKRF